MAQKQAHSLLRIPPPELAEQLAREGSLSQAHLAAELGVTPPSVGLLFVGSLAEGDGTPASDIDLLCLVETRPLTVPDTYLETQLDQGTELIRYWRGCEVNIEVRSAAELVPYVATVRDGLAQLSRRKALTVLPTVNEPVFRFIHRLATGHVVAGQATVASWRERLTVTSLASYMALAYYVEFREMSEKLANAGSLSPGTDVLIARQCLMAALQSLCATMGHTNPSQRLIFNGVDKLAGGPAADDEEFKRSAVALRKALVSCTELSEELREVVRQVTAALRQRMQVADLKAAADVIERSIEYI